MSTALRIAHGAFGRVALLDMDRPLVRHAHPHTVRITITDEAAHWELAVTDDGVGMTPRPDVYAGEGFGLSSMRQRAGAIGGEWQINSTPGTGTRVSVRILKRAA